MTKQQRIAEANRIATAHETTIQDINEDADFFELPTEMLPDRKGTIGPVTVCWTFDYEGGRFESFVSLS